MMFSEILIKMSSKEDIAKEMVELKAIHDKITKFVDDRKFSNNKDSDYLEKMSRD